MKSRFWLFGAFAFCYIIVAAAHVSGAAAPIPWPDTSAETREAQSKLTGQPSDLSNQDEFVRGLALARLVDERAKLVSYLVDAVKKGGADKSPLSTFCLAAKALGVVRATEGVDALAAHLTYLPSEESQAEQLEYEAKYPCAKSLAMIGDSAATPMLQVIELSEDRNERRLAVWVILRVDGQDQALHRIDVEAGKCTKQEYRNHCSEAKAYIQNYKPDFRSPYDNPATASTQPAKAGAK